MWPPTHPTYLAYPTCLTYGVVTLSNVACAAIVVV